MKIVPVDESIGMVLCHDVTRIIPGEFKGPAFRRGHVVETSDIPILLSIGKEHLHILEMEDGLIHENEAALRIAGAAAGQGIHLLPPKEGKVDLVASWDGLLKVNVETLHAVNSDDEIMFATIHTNQRVPRGKQVGGTRIIPLVIHEERILHAEEICRSMPPLMEVRPLRSLKVGIITTGSEVYHGRIEDRFGPVVMAKLQETGCTVLGQILVSDSAAMIVEAVHTFLRQGAQMIALTGGMSVDPDDVTPSAIRATGARVVTYGAPTLPGAMFMLAYLGDVPLLGLPGCVMYHRTSIFDLVLPRILSGEEMTRNDFIQMAHGGLCVHCDPCRYPDCGFGKCG